MNALRLSSGKCPSFALLVTARLHVETLTVPTQGSPNVPLFAVTVQALSPRQALLRSAVLVVALHC
jgi:hypothetical protein